MATVLEEGIYSHGRTRPRITTVTFGINASSHLETDRRSSTSRSLKHPQYQTLQSRLGSFVGWPGKYVPKTPEELSAAGFYYIGSADRVTCFQCGITLRDWEEEHDPVAEHRRYSEDCEFINTPDLHQLGVAARPAQVDSGDKTPYDEDLVSNSVGSLSAEGHQVVAEADDTVTILKEMGFTETEVRIAVVQFESKNGRKHRDQSELIEFIFDGGNDPISMSRSPDQQSRLGSFVGWPGKYVPKTPEELSAAGFYYIGSADRVTCFQCGITLRDWKEEHDPVTEHRRYSENCDNSKNKHSTKNPKRQWKHPKFESEKARLESFSTLQGQPHATEMASAVFFYTGKDDQVTCFRYSTTQHFKRIKIQHFKRPQNCMKDHQLEQICVDTDKRLLGDDMTFSNSQKNSRSVGEICLKPAGALSIEEGQMTEPSRLKSEDDEDVESVAKDDLFGDRTPMKNGAAPISVPYQKIGSPERLMSGSEAGNDVIYPNALSEIPNVMKTRGSGDFMPEYSEDMISGTDKGMLSDASINMMSKEYKDEMSYEPRDAKPGNPMDVKTEEQYFEMLEDPKAALQENPMEEMPGAPESEEDTSDAPGDLMSEMKKRLKKYMKKYMACFGLQEK